MPAAVTVVLLFAYRPTTKTVDTTYDPELATGRAVFSANCSGCHGPAGEGLSGGDVLEVKVQSGDVVAKGQALLEIEAEKSTVEVPAPVSGTLTKWLVKKGDVVKAGQVLAYADSKAAQPAAKPPKSDQAPEKKSPEATKARNSA